MAKSFIIDACSFKVIEWQQYIGRCSSDLIDT